MKKVFFGFAALLALVVFSCGDFAVPQTEAATPVITGYTDDGREIMELDLGVGISDNDRALHETLAKAASDFYEVIFCDASATPKYYRASWREGRTARLRLPVGNYAATPNYAYIFAGRWDDMLLLGVGTIKSVSNFDGTNTTTITSPTAGYGTVTAETVRIDFEIVALTTDVTKEEATSTFQPGTWTPIASGAGAPGTFTASTGSQWQVETITVSDEKIPVFMFPANNSGADAAAFDITCATPTLLAQIKYAGTASYISKPYAWLDSIEDLPIDLKDVTFLDTQTVNTSVTFPIHMQIETNDNNTKGKGGLCLLGIQVPVCLSTNAAAENGTAAAAKTWYLRGGLNNTLLDMGYDNTGMGGAVLIGSGNVLNGNGIVIGGVYKPNP